MVLVSHLTLLAAARSELVGWGTRSPTRHSHPVVLISGSAINLTNIFIKISIRTIDFISVTSVFTYFPIYISPNDITS